VAAALVAWRARPLGPHASPVGQALDELERDVVTVSHDANAPLSPSGPVTPALRRALGDPGATTFDELRRELRRAAGTESADARDPFYADVGSVNAALTRAHQPFFLDAEIVPRGPDAAWPLVYSFYIERETEATSGDGPPVRVVYLWRFDRMNVGPTYLGYTHPRAGAALVLLDRIEEELIELILPTLKEGEPLALLDAKSADPGAPWQATLGARAGEVVRAYFATDADAAALRRIGELLAKRRAVVETWKRELPLVGLRLRPPTRLVPESDYAGELRHRVGRASLDDWDDLHEELLRPANIETFERLRDRLARSTERHEVQHRLDYTRGLVAAPALLAERLGLESRIDLLPGTYPARCRDETSAYLAQMADASDSPTLTLVMLARFLFDRGHWGSPYSCAAQMVFELLGRELAVPGAEEPLVTGGSVRRDALAGRFGMLLDHPPAELREASGSAWAGAFGAPLPPVTSRETARNARWRH
jgi:hypothetical protein